MGEYVDGFASMLKNVRMNLNLTQAKMAEMLDITVGHYQNLERGRKKPKAEIVYRLILNLKIWPEVIFMLPEDQYISDIFTLVRQCNDEQRDNIRRMLHSMLNTSESGTDAEK